METKTSKILALARKNPHLTCAQVAQKVGVRRQHVYKVTSSAGIKLRDGRYGARASVVHPRIAGVQITAAAVGAAAELLICHDLICRGWYVYRAMTSHSPCDLVAIRDDVLLRIEVRSCVISATGSPAYAHPYDREYDVLALVSRDSKVFYRGPSASHLQAADTSDVLGVDVAMPTA